MQTTLTCEPSLCHRVQFSFPKQISRTLINDRSSNKLGLLLLYSCFYLTRKANSISFFVSVNCSNFTSTLLPLVCCWLVKQCQKTLNIWWGTFVCLLISFFFSQQLISFTFFVFGQKPFWSVYSFLRLLQRSRPFKWSIHEIPHFKSKYSHSSHISVTSGVSFVNPFVLVHINRHKRFHSVSPTIFCRTLLVYTSKGYSQLLCHRLYVLVILTPDFCFFYGWPLLSLCGMWWRHMWLWQPLLGCTQ